MEYWRVLNVNPEPWVVPQFSVGKNKKTGKAIAIAGKNLQLAAFQDAVKEAVGDPEELITGELRLTFYFWRRLEVYQGIGRKVTKNPVDATNMQKSTEDALQGVYFGNDRQVRDVRSVIVEQATDISARIVLHVENWYLFNPDEIPSHIWAEIEKQDTIFDIAGLQESNVWPPPAREN